MSFRTRLLKDGRARTVQVFEGGLAPFCSHEECGQFDGKRCKEYGFVPDRVCVPEVEDLLSELSLLRKGFR